MTSPGEGRGSSEPQIERGQMPEPKYLVEAFDTYGDGDIKWIGMQAFAPDGTIRDFLLWRNFQAGNLEDEQVRRDLAAFVARMKMEMDADVAIGKPVDIWSSDPESGKVVVIGEDVIGEEGIYGVYVEADKRPMFNFSVAMSGVKDEEALRAEHPERFEEIFSGALGVLPRGVR